VVEWNSLENCRIARYPEFESLSLRHNIFRDLNDIKLLIELNVSGKVPEWSNGLPC
jgi:hypothetical protein